MTRKRVTSTYRREFSPERSAQSREIQLSFDANFNYREYRRQVEHGHHRSPFVWDDWEYQLEEMTPRSSRVKPTASEGSSSNGSTPSKADSHKNSIEAQTKSLERNNKTFIKLSTQPHKSQSSSEDDEDSAECNCQPSRNIRGYKTTKFFKNQGQPPRVLSDTISKEKKNVCESKTRRPKSAVASGCTSPEDVPFVQYGMGDDEVVTGNKRTYNIHAPQGVYPSAARAKTRRFVERQVIEDGLHLEAQRSRPNVRFDPHFDNKMNQDTTRWLSEYNKNYRPHSADVYSRNRHHKPPY